jgi:hypothetical protein
MNVIHALLDELIDFAGLFPPAAMDMEAAASRFEGHRGGRHAFGLGRFVLPVGRFGEFEVAVQGRLPVVPDVDDPEQAPDLWAISALVSPAEDLDAVKRDLEAIESFNDRHTEVGAGAAIVDTIELKATSGEAVDAVLDLLDDDIYPYFELDPSTDVRGTLAAIAGLDGGAKIRTGGVTADAHPTVEQVAAFIAACRMADVPFKATAGLHHAIRAHQSSVDAKQFGFLNVFLGAALMHAGRVDAKGLAEVLADEDASNFTMSDGGVAWRDRRLTIDQLAEARSRFCHSFGSCSFQEPIDELITMGWLKAPANTAPESR